VQLPTVCEPAAQAFVVEVQLAPDSATDPLVQVAVAEPEKPAVELVAVVVAVCVSAPYEYVQLPRVCVPAPQGFAGAVQVAPESVTAPLTHVAVADPVKHDAVLLADPVAPCVSAP